MDKFCDKCIDRRCDECYGKSEAPLSEKVKQTISKNLTHFLLSDRRAPDEIIISVRYPQSSAKLVLKLDALNASLKEAYREETYDSRNDR